MLDTFSFGVTSNLSQQKSPTAGIIGICFLGTIVPRKYMPIISTVGLFCCDKFEETPNEKVSNMSKLTKSYFRGSIFGLSLYFLKISLETYWPHFQETKYQANRAPPPDLVQKDLSLELKRWRQHLLRIRIRSVHHEKCNRNSKLFGSFQKCNFCNI